MQEQITTQQDHSAAPFAESFAEKVVTLYCLCDDFLRATGHKDDPQAQMTSAEVMTTALTAAALFDGNQERSRCFLREHGYIQAMLSWSRLTPIKP